MASYTVQAGDSWARIAGSQYGDQRRYLDLANANGGLGMLHPGDVINLPDFSNAPAPVITNQQWAQTPTGVKNGQVQYDNANGRGAAAPTNAGVQLPTTSGVQLPNIGSAGAYDPRTGDTRGTTPGGAGAANSRPKPPKFGPNSAGQYDSRVNRNAGVTGAGAGAMPSNRPAALPASGPGFNAAVNQPARQTRQPAGYEKKPTPVPAVDPYGGGPNPYLPVGGIAPWQAGERPMPGAPGPVAGFQAPQTSGTYQPVGPAGFPQPVSAVDPSMANVASAARYSAMAIYAYGGGYADQGRAGGDRNTLPTIIHALVAAQLPRPPGMSDADYMGMLGYAPDADGNYVRQDPVRNAGYGGAAYDTQTVAPSYGGYGGGGYGGGYGGYPSYGRAAVTTQPYGLVNWRITG